MSPPSPHKLTALLAVSSVFAIAVQHPLAAQQRPLVADLKQRTVTLKLTGRSLAEIVAAVAPLVGHGILVDDVPNLKSADLDLHGTAAEALDRIAEAFDYSWSESKNGTILMVKRFHDLDEHPQCNPREMRQVALEMTRILSAIEYERNPRESPLRTMGKSLSQEQISLLLSGRFIRMTEFPPPQQSLLIDCILHSLFGDTREEWTHVYQALERFDQSYLRAGVEEIDQDRKGNKVPYWMFDYWSPTSGSYPVRETILSNPVSSGGAP